jgi:hypothetical protein
MTYKYTLETPDQPITCWGFFWNNNWYGKRADKMESDLWSSKTKESRMKGTGEKKTNIGNDNNYKCGRNQSIYTNYYFRCEWSKQVLKDRDCQNGSKT